MVSHRIAATSVGKIQIKKINKIRSSSSSVYIPCFLQIRSSGNLFGKTLCPASEASR